MKLTIPDFKKMVQDEILKLNTNLYQVSQNLKIPDSNLRKFFETNKKFLPIIPKISKFVLGKKATVQINQIYFVENEACDFTLFSSKLKDFCRTKKEENKKFSVRNVCIELDIPISAKISLIRQGIYVQIKTEHLQKFFAYFEKKYDYREEIFVIIE